MSDINRARVLRIRSVMTRINGAGPGDAYGEIDVNATLEDLIAQSGGDTSHSYVVTQNGEPVGTLDMKDLVRALVPRLSSVVAPADM